jgi:hypothetical protein
MEHAMKILKIFDSGARSTNDLDRLGQTVPAYRPAPDYETAVLSKFQGNRITQVRQKFQKALVVLILFESFGPISFFQIPEFSRVL